MTRRKLYLALCLMSLLFVFLYTPPAFSAEKIVQMNIPDCG